MHCAKMEELHSNHNLTVERMLIVQFNFIFGSSYYGVYMIEGLAAGGRSPDTLCP